MLVSTTRCIHSELPGMMYSMVQPYMFVGIDKIGPDQLFILHLEFSVKSLNGPQKGMWEEQ